MTPQTPAEPSAPQGLSALLAPQKDRLRQSAVLSVMASLLWLLQAALVAKAFGAALNGIYLSAAGAALGFAALGAVRAGLGMLAEARADAASDAVILTARTDIVTAEARRAADSPFGGAGSVSALAGEKLDLLAPYIKRYVVARARVSVVPLAILGVALWYSWAVAIILLISGPLIPVFMALIGMAAKEASRRQMSEIGSLNDLLIERLSALVDIRLLGATEGVVAGFKAQTGDLRDRTMAVLRVAFLSSTVLELFAAIGVAMVAVYVGFSLLGALEFGAWRSGLTPEAGILLLLLAPEFYQPLRDLSAAWHDKAAAEAVAEDFAAWQAGDTRMLLGQGAPATPLAGPATIALRGCHLDNCLALPDIDIAAGESVAIMGPSGAGKTSALRLMAGLLVPQSGSVMVAGHLLEASNADNWRARLGWMPQAVHFLNASLRHNLRLGRDGDLAAALRQAAMQDVVAGLPRGLDTRLGESGGGLSGGEARRLTLARAIFAAPDVILADEPTADLDSATAQLVADGLLAQARRGATLVIVTHDSDLAARMDRTVQIGGRP